MRHFLIGITCFCAGLGFSGLVSASAVDTLQQRYQADGAGPFNSAAGRKRWQEKHLDAKSGKPRSCQTCHGNDLKTRGKHVRTGKRIEPMAPSVNPERLSDVKFIEKWFKRNCKWAFGRECSSQEKGDFLEYLRGL